MYAGDAGLIRLSQHLQINMTPLVTRWLARAALGLTTGIFFSSPAQLLTVEREKRVCSVPSLDD